MTTFTIYYGAEKPIKAVGANQVNLLQFLSRFPVWHYYRVKDRATRRAVAGLIRRGAIKRDCYGRIAIIYAKTN